MAEPAPPRSAELHPRQMALIEAVRQASNTGVFVAGPINTALAQDLAQRGLIRLEALPGGQPQPAFMALPPIASDPAGYPFDRVVTLAREWAMMRWHLSDVTLISETVKRSVESRESISPREIVDRLASRFGLEDPHQGQSPRDVATRSKVQALGEVMEREWRQALGRAGPNADDKLRPLSASERARAQLIRR